MSEEQTVAQSGTAASVKDLRWLLKIIGGSATPTCEWQTHPVWHRLQAFCDKLDADAPLNEAAPDLLAIAQEVIAHLGAPTELRCAASLAIAKATAA